MLYIHYTQDKVSTYAEEMRKFFVIFLTVQCVLRANIELFFSHLHTELEYQNVYRIYCILYSTQNTSDAVCIFI